MLLLGLCCCINKIVSFLMAFVGVVIRPFTYLGYLIVSFIALKDSFNNINVPQRLNNSYVPQRLNGNSVSSGFNCNGLSHSFDRTLRSNSRRGGNNESGLAD
jgi:hypothetical protein